TASSISLNTQALRTYFSELAFAFWGETDESMINELLAFYFAARQLQDYNTINTCNLGSANSDVINTELASWRMVFIRMMTDYHYLYE
ncbi:MAG TPA: hypothetical protein PKE57_05295, partial [Cellvibrionaceae bacterium]|nr:hypothetical protein [Cellvibrionaceae bacterium]